jgi:O-acetyl-ADP-ribose deacetylase (regulator of RNase III)
MNQNERLDYLVEQFKEDSVQYRDLETPEDPAGKKRILRSLMNIRMPRMMAPSVLAVQDEYLKERNRENGIVQISDIPTIADQGSRHSHADHISLWQGDITRLAADAIVNAANSQMLGCFQPCHACIDNCIHTYAVMQLRLECHQKMTETRKVCGMEYEQPTSVPMLTGAYNLPCKHVIHVVGPIVYDRLTEEHERLLAQCYTNVLDMCKTNGIRSVAFCCISTGVFRFPNRNAAEIAIDTVSRWLMHDDSMEKVIFNVFLDKDRELYEKLLS